MNTSDLVRLTFAMVFLLLCNIEAVAQQSNKESVVALKLPGMEHVIIKNDIPYQTNPASTLRMDIYYPPKFDFKGKIPAIIFISGCADSSVIKLVGSTFRKWSAYTSWCKLVAASGMAAIVYETVDPKKDLISLIEYVRFNQDKLSIRKNSVGAFVCSGHTPTAVCNILNSSSNIFNCAVLYYGFILTHDSEYISNIEPLFKQMGFPKPPILTDPTNWKKDIPLLIVRAGSDNIPFLNQAMAEFYNLAIKQNLPLTFINYPKGPHGFDVYTDNDTTRQIIKTTLDFWKFNLQAK